MSEASRPPAHDAGPDAPAQASSIATRPGLAHPVPRRVRVGGMPRSCGLLESVGVAVVPIWGQCQGSGLARNFLGMKAVKLAGGTLWWARVETKRILTIRPVILCASLVSIQWSK